MPDGYQSLRESVQPEPEPWTRVHTVEALVTALVASLLIALGVFALANGRFDTVLLVFIPGGLATLLAIVAAKDRNAKLIKWAFGLALLGILVVIGMGAQKQTDAVNDAADAIIASNPDDQEKFCELVLSERFDAELAEARSSFIERYSENQPPPGLVWDELVSRC